MLHAIKRLARAAAATTLKMPATASGASAARDEILNSDARSDADATLPLQEPRRKADEEFLQAEESLRMAQRWSDGMLSQEALAELARATNPGDRIDGRTPLMFAAAAGLSELVLELAPHSDTAALSTCYLKRSPLMFAAQSGSIECVKALLPLCDPKQSTPKQLGEGGETALMVAAVVLGQRSDLEELLIGVSDVDALNYLDMTALMLAAKHGNASMVRRLLPHSDVDAVDYYGRSALAHAGGDVECVRALAEVANPNQRVDRGWTAFLSAAARQDAAILRLLMPRADLSLTLPGGTTALMIAAQHGNAEGVSLLLPLVDVLARNESGYDAIGLAEVTNRLDTADQIRAYALAMKEEAELRQSIGSRECSFSVEDGRPLRRNSL